MPSQRSELPKVVFRESLARPIQLAGGDRRLVAVSAMFGFYIGFITSITYGIYWGVPLGGIVWGIGHILAVKAGKYDPFFFDVAVRHLKYRGFHPARGRFDAFLRNHKDF